MEFQVAPMVDVLLELLLFFMATTTTEVITQTANLDLPKADATQTTEKSTVNQIIINIEKLNYRIKMNDVYYDDPNAIVPILRGAYQQAIAGEPNKPFRVIVRADAKTPFQRISGVMKACADAGVLDVVFMADDPKAGQHSEEKK